jgi:hypothetical protein
LGGIVVTNGETIVECFKSALIEIKEDLPEFMQTESMFDYFIVNWQNKIRNKLIEVQREGKQFTKSEWKVILDYAKNLIPLQHDVNMTKVSVKFGHKFLEELNNKQKEI